MIEEDPPLFLYEDKRIEAQQPQVGNNQASESPESAGYAQELASGENLKKYNILLQRVQLDILNPHTVTCAFLNDNTSSKLQKADDTFIPKIAPIFQQKDLALLELMLNGPCPVQ